MFTGRNTYPNTKANVNKEEQIARRLGYLCTILVFLIGGSAVALFAFGMVGWFAEKPVPNYWILSFGYGAAIALFKLTSPLFKDLATGQHFGEPLGQTETMMFRIVGMSFVNAPHAVFIAWAAWFYGATPLFPDWTFMISALLGLVAWHHLRTRRLRILLSAGHRSQLAISLMPGDPLRDRILDEVKRNRYLEAVKAVRSEKGVGLMEAESTVRRVQWEEIAREHEIPRN